MGPIDGCAATAARHASSGVAWPNRDAGKGKSKRTPETHTYRKISVMAYRCGIRYGIGGYNGILKQQGKTKQYCGQRANPACNHRVPPWTYVLDPEKKGT